MSESSEVGDAFFYSPFRSRRGGMRRLVPRQLAEALIRGEGAEVEVAPKVEAREVTAEAVEEEDIAPEGDPQGRRLRARIR